MNKENINRLYQLMVEDDEMLMGSQWDEMYCNEYDTPKSILDNFINIYLATNFVEIDDDLKTTPLANQEEKIMALIKYLEKIINDLKNRTSSENNINNWGRRMKKSVVESFLGEKVKVKCTDNDEYTGILEKELYMKRGIIIVKMK